LRRQAIAVFGAVLMVSMALGAQMAQAAGRYDSVGAFGSAGSEDGQFSPTGRLAVDATSGDVFVIDRGLESGVPRIEVFAPGGGTATYLTQFGGGTLQQPTGIAVDADSGDVYVSDAGAEEIFKFNSDGAATPTFSLDSSFPSPPSGSAAGELGGFAAPLAFDDAANRLLVADPVSNQVDRFQPDGTFESRFDGSDSGAAFSNIRDIAALPGGEVIVADGGRVERFDAAGNDAGSLAGLPGQPDRLAYDSLAQEILVGHSGVFFEVAVYRVSPLTNRYVGSLSHPEGEAFNGSLVGLVASGNGTGRVYVGTGLDGIVNLFGSIGVQVFATGVLPDLLVDPASGVTSNGAHLSGAIDPLGQPATHYRLEYSGDGGSNWALAAEGEAAGESLQAVEADVTGLRPNTLYQVRLSGTNEQGENTSALEEFTTAVSPPIVVTGEATDWTTTAATLRGSVNALGLQTTYHFEYGLETSYGSRLPAAHEAVAGNGHAPLPVAQQVSGLQPGQTYHYRLVAQNSAGVEVGEDRTFTVQAAAPPGRAYELVSPADKGGAQVQEYLGFQAAADGSSMVFATRTAMSGSVQGEAAPQNPYYSARRSNLGWATIGLDPPQIVNGSFAQAFWETLAVSEDGSRALVISLKKLAPGAVEGDSNMYLRDTATGAYTTIGVAPGNSYYVMVRSTANYNFFVAGTSDFSHVVFDGGGVGTFIPGTPAGMYEWTDGQLRYVSILPDGTLVNSDVDDDGDRGKNRISADGSRVFFSRGFALYVRDGSTTTLVSASHQAADLGEPRGGRFISASRDGHIVYLAGQELTEDSPLNRLAIYRANVDSGTLEVVAPADGGLGASDDGSRLYLTTAAQLLPSVPLGVSAIYLWNEGSLQYVGPSSSLAGFQTSPSGRFAVFTTSQQVTGFDNAGKVEAYRYDADADLLACVSCRRDGGLPSGDVNIGWNRNNLSRHYSRSVLDDGRVFFDTPDRLVATDANSSRDVYEYDDGAVRLISAGQSGGDSRFADTSADGDDVFFTTEDRLVREDADTARDVYDARVGGGIASQSEEPPSPSCIAEGCRGLSGAAPAATAVGSEGGGGQRSSSPRRRGTCRASHRKQASKKQRCPAKRHKKAGDRRQAR
jgi:hypothetical protein